MRLLPVFMVSLAAVGPVQVTAQQALQSVTSLVSQGRSDQARRALIEWWDQEWRGASRLDKQRGLWMRARLTVDPALAALDYQRLVVEYPGGPYSDGALYRLAQAAEAALWSTEAAPAEETREEAPVESGGYAVQLGAFSDATGARRIADRAEAEGFGVRMVRVPGSELVRVRVGRFENQEDALELMRRVKAGGFEVTLVTDAAQEDPIA